MRIATATLDSCAAATGTVVVVDVLRAFTTAAVAFASGAREIWLVGTVEEAFALRERHPDVLLMGEVDGLPIEGFDLSNSPSALLGADLHGRVLVHRTSAGTQGVVRSTGADVLVGASFVCAAATAGHLADRGPNGVTFVVTGADERRDGDEDRACADYLAALLDGETPDPAHFVQRVRQSTTGRVFADPGRPEFPRDDLELAVDMDRFPTALPIQRRHGLLVMTPAVP